MDENSYDNNSLIFMLDNGVKFFPDRRYITGNSGTIINLSENSYRFLTLLLKGETDKQYIINQVWHEQRGAVSDSSYYGQIYSLRKTLSLVGISGSVIKTLPRRGVKYMGKVEMMYHMDENAPDLPDIQTTDSPEFETVTEEKNSETDNKINQIGWLHSRHWNIMISVLAVIAVCWLATLAVAVFFFLL